MARSTRLIKSFYKLLLPVAVLFILAVVGSSVWLVHEVAQPLRPGYLVTPEKYGQLSSRAAQISEETWKNTDGSSARGWLLRGDPNAPGVVLLHRYGADRSHVLNLGVKLNEATNFTILMPDQRGHGVEPAVKRTSFGGCEADDLAVMIEFLRGLVTTEQLPLVGKDIGVYGLELGALAALSTASKEPSVKAIVLDSIPNDSDALLEAAIDRRFPFASAVSARFASLGAYPYFYEGCFRREPICETAKAVSDRRVLLLGGLDAPMFRDSTSKLSKCFSASTTVDVKTDLSPSGYSIFNASIDQSESYDQRVIDFLRQALSLP
jgi:pimeloyl-ACP methyl ester carboxylesterase